MDRGGGGRRVCECECGDVDHKKENVKVLLRSARFFKCNFFLSHSLSLPLSPFRSLTCSFFSEPSPGNLAHGFFPSTLVLLSCFFEVVLSFELCFGVFVLFRVFFLMYIIKAFCFDVYAVASTDRSLDRVRGKGAKSTQWPW